jgi:hypothetical protein
MDEKYRSAAQLIFGIDGDVEVKDDAEVRQSEEGGRWVQAWVFVADEEVEELGPFSEKEENLEDSH